MGEAAVDDQTLQTFERPVQNTGEFHTQPWLKVAILMVQPGAVERE
jgi:hypothetical protein